ncbi:restriction endonuclease subunit S [Acetobacterium carbinolicum]|uniref:restriction endonuclease subunit S n=1 Tax=Acetobacterium carbinolicum TaxID=52690 RepID=UPI0039BEFFBD
MKAQDLKNSILQLAIQGKLVEQKVEEGTAKELLEKIAAEKKQLIQEGKIKKQKALPAIKEDEIPFDIPDSWEWVRLGELCNYGKCNSIPATKIPKEAWLLDLEDIEKDTGRILNKKRMKDVKSNSSKHIFNTGNVLYSKLRPYLNKVVIADEDGYSTSEILPLDFGMNIFDRYAQIVLMSPYFINYTVKCSYGVKMPRLGTTDGQLAVFPLPPLEEQKRIVAKIEELMPYVEKYDVAYSEVVELNKKFPEDMQKSILQYAIQGKLVAQRKEDGTAEELYQQIQEEKKKLIEEGKIKKTKALPEITEDEIPFDIPENWKWVRLGNLLNKLTDGTHSTPKYTVTGVPFISVKDVSGGKMDFSNTKFISQEEHDSLYKRCNPERDDILLTKVGTTGIPVIVDSDQEFSLFVSVALLKFNTDLIFNKYFMYAIKAPVVQIQARENTRGVGNKNWVMRDIANTILPLPPLNEQKRIVDELEKLLPYTKQLVK